MKKLLLLSLSFVAGVHTACAFTYTNTDLLLIFRKDGFNDVEFNLGSVSNFLGHADGAQLSVTNWDQSLVRGNFNNSLAGVDVTLQAATANEDSQRRVWLTDASATGTPTDVSGSKWSQLRSKIDFVGVQATIVTDASADQSYVVSANLPSSYTQIASSGGSLDVITISPAIGPVSRLKPEAQTARETGHGRHSQRRASKPLRHPKGRGALGNGLIGK